MYLVPDQTRPAPVVTTRAPTSGTGKEAAKRLADAGASW